MRIVLATCALVFVACGSDLAPGSGDASLDAAHVAIDAAAVDGASDAAPAPRDAAADAMDARADVEARDASPPDVSAPDVLETGVAEARVADAAAPIAYLRDPPPLATYSHMVCPHLTGGATAATSQVTGFRSGADTRSFRLLVPSNYDGSSAWPLVFAYHWLGSSSASFIRDAELETAAAQMHVIFVLPDHLTQSNGNKVYLFEWPFVETWGAEAELVFFDDVLACVSGQFNIDPRRVHIVGASAGGLWITYVMSTDRANHIASMMSISGGLGAADVPIPGVPTLWHMDFVPEPDKYPAMVIWGGPNDWLILNFAEASTRLRASLLVDHHFIASCTHSNGHGLPPIDPPGPGITRFRVLWQFFLDHPYGLPPDTSPWITNGPPPGYPSWCTTLHR